MKKPQIKMIIFECPLCGKMRIGNVWSFGRFECEDCGQQWNIDVCQGSSYADSDGIGTLRTYLEQRTTAGDDAKGDREDWFGVSEKRIA